MAESRRERRERLARERAGLMPSPSTEGGASTRQNGTNGSEQGKEGKEVHPVVVHQENNLVSLSEETKHQLKEMFDLAIREARRQERMQVLEEVQALQPPYWKLFFSGVGAMLIMVLAMGACLHSLQKADRKAIGDQMATLQRSLQDSLKKSGKQVQPEEVRISSLDMAKVNSIEGQLEANRKAMMKFFSAFGKIQQPPQPQVMVTKVTPPTAPAPKPVQRVVTGKTVMVVNQSSKELKVYELELKEDGTEARKELATILPNTMKSISYEGHHGIKLMTTGEGMESSKEDFTGPGPWAWRFDGTNHGVRSQ